MPGLAYFKNHLGMKLTDEEFEDIPYPRAELITHVTIKDIQAFGLLGTFLVGPLAAIARKNTRNARGVVNLATKCGKWGVVLAFAAGPAMTIGRMKSLEEPAIVDRCYRLRRNRNQVRVDQNSFVGAVIGGTAGTLLGQPPALLTLLGMNAGVLAAAIYNGKKGDKTT